MCNFEKLLNGEGGSIEKNSPPNKIKPTSKSSDPNPDLAAARQNAAEPTVRNYLRDYLDDANHVEPDHRFNWNRDGTQRLVVKRLRDGHYQSDAQLDLHFKTIKEAWQLIWDFLEESLEKGLRNVRIVHGKGERVKPPARPARMKSYVGQVLQEHLDVFGFCTAEPDQGGSGTTLVWLRKSQEEKDANRERHQSRRS